MGFKLRIQTFFFSLMVFAFLFGQCFQVTEGFKQSLKLYFDNTTEGDSLDFVTNHPNLDDYSALLPKVQYACGLGLYDANYLGSRKRFGLEGSNQPYCVPFNASNTKSIRHLGMSETTSDGLSLYDVAVHIGTEILVEGSAYAGITTPVKSISGTGNNSEWKLFKGQHLEGKSVCIKVPHPGYHLYWLGYVSSINLTSIGSVFKGCNILEIEEYKRQNNI